MFSWLPHVFGWLVGNSNSAEKTIDAVINSGDALVFTEQEKDASNHKKLDALIRYAEATQSQSVARRFIAASLTFLFTLLILLVVAFGYFDRTEESFAFFVFNVLKDLVLQPFSIVVAFYFLGMFSKKRVRN